MTDSGLMRVSPQSVNSHECLLSAMADFRSSAIAKCRGCCRLSLIPSAHRTCGKHKIQDNLFFRQYRFKLMTWGKRPDFQGGPRHADIRIGNRKPL